MADRLWFEGDFEDAIEIYSAVAQLGQETQRQQALHSLARAHYQRGDLTEAAAALTALLDADPPAETRRQALLLLGAAYQQSGRPGAAINALRHYIEEGGPAVASARITLASALTAQGQGEQAMQGLELALAEDLPPPLATAALDALARAQEAAGLNEDALATWERLSRDGAAPFDRGQALWDLAMTAERMGDDARYQEALVELAREYPWHPRALDSLGLAQPPALSAAERGIVLFRHRLNEQAEEAFRSALAEDGSAVGQATAHLYLGFLAERAGLPDDALLAYEAALDALVGNEGDRLYGEAAWERALLLESLGRTDEAITAYSALADASPGSARAPESLFRAGFLSFLLGRPADATFHWTRYLQAAPAAETPRARFWLARAAIAIGDSASANAHLAEAASASGGWDYFALRARSLLEGEAQLSLDEPAPQPPAPDWPAAEQWLAGWAGPEDAARRLEMVGGPAWTRGMELLSAGLQVEARDQFLALINEVAAEPWLLYRLTRALDELGQTELASRSATRLTGDREDTPAELLRIAYPDDYLELAAAEAETNGFPPLLLLALIRQESFFRPDAQSSALALGLTQVIPTTADEIAGQLDETDFTFTDLTRPKLSLRFGAHYLGSQLSLFEGNISAALAAYNGGPGNSLRWREAAGDDPDLFLETIDFAETRAYVELVLEHYARYRYAYGLSEAPGLPLD